MEKSIILAALLTLLSTGAEARSVGPQSPCVEEVGKVDDERVALDEALNLIDAWLEAQRAYWHVGALVVGVTVDEKVSWAKGYGALDAAGKVPATPQSIFSICSISKVFTSIALMQQWESGRVRLDEPLTTYLPWAELKPSAHDGLPVTLRAVLSHSAGLPREAAFPYWAAPDFTFPSREALRATVGQQDMLYGASRYVQYSNLGMALAGEVVEAVGGKPYATLIRDQITGPLGLNDTRVGLPLELYGTRLAVAYGAMKRDGTRDVLRPFDTQGLAPAAGLTSTVEDLGKFAAWQLRLLRTDNTEVLRAATLREMQRVHFVDPDWQVTRGLGFWVSHDDMGTFVGHDGACPGYFTEMSLHPASHAAVVVMMNAAEPTRPLVKGTFALMAKRRGFKFQGPPPAAVDLTAYAGHYSEQPWGAEGVVVPWAGGLAYLSLPSGAPAQDVMLLKPNGTDSFRRIRADGSEAEEIRFERDATGKVVRLVRHNHPAPRL